MKLFVIGYPGDIGGANTECWHTIKLWRSHGVDVHLIPTWGRDDRWRARLDALGCTTHHVAPDKLESVPGLAGTPVVGMCNAEFMAQAPRLRKLSCPIVWVNCMTFLFEHEKRFFAEHGPADAMVYQSEFQRTEIEPQLAPFDYDPATGHLIHGAFDIDEWEFRPRPHLKGEVFVVGRAARPDQDKWSSNTWPIYDRIQYGAKRAFLLGMDDRTHAKLGQAPEWADCLKPAAIAPQQFFANLHLSADHPASASDPLRARLRRGAGGRSPVADRAFGSRATGQTGR